MVYHLFKCFTTIQSINQSINQSNVFIKPLLTSADRLLSPSGQPGNERIVCITPVNIVVYCYTHTTVGHKDSFSLTTVMGFIDLDICFPLYCMKHSAIRTH